MLPVNLSAPPDLRQQLYATYSSEGEPDTGALPDTLVEPVLFGHVRGACAEAKRGRQGLLAMAEGGILLRQAWSTRFMA
jgi:hypothetical protein